MIRPIIVTGGRDYDDWDKVRQVLDLIDFDVLIQGGATGADALALKYAKERGKTHHTVEADWTKHGRRAGHMRNSKMLQMFPNAAIVAFPGNNGTNDCVEKAIDLGRIVLRVR